MSEVCVRTIVETYLKENGYDGLCNDDCGCGIGEDFMPCSGAGHQDNCVPAMEVPYDYEKHGPHAYLEPEDSGKANIYLRAATKPITHKRTEVVQ